MTWQDWLAVATVVFVIGVAAWRMHKEMGIDEPRSVKRRMRWDDEDSQ